MNTHLDDDGVASTTTLREAILQTDPTDGADEIRFSADIPGGTITITGGNVTVPKRVVINGQIGTEGKIQIQKGETSTATSGLQFQNFNLSPGGTAADTGVFNLAIVGFDVGIKLSNLTSGTFDVDRPFKIIGNKMSDVGTGIWFDNADVPFHIESNVIQGRSSGVGRGIFLQNSGQFTATGTLVPSPTIQPTIGRAEQSAGNTITFFSNGIQVESSCFLRCGSAET